MRSLYCWQCPISETEKYFNTNEIRKWQKKNTNQYALSRNYLQINIHNYGITQDTPRESLQLGSPQPKWLIPNQVELQPQSLYLYLTCLRWEKKQTSWKNWDHPKLNQIGMISPS